jgi:hypothetical protein
MWRSNGPVELESVTLANSRLSLVLSGTVPSQSNRHLRAISKPAVPALEEMSCLAYNFRQHLLMMN